MNVNTKHGQSNVRILLFNKPASVMYFISLKQIPERKKNSGMWKE